MRAHRRLRASATHRRDTHSLSLSLSRGRAFASRVAVRLGVPAHNLQKWSRLYGVRRITSLGTFAPCFARRGRRVEEEERASPWNARDRNCRDYVSAFYTLGDRWDGMTWETEEQ